MTALLDHAADYPQLRRGLGHMLADAHRLLPRFVACLDAAGATTVTVEAALAWARCPDTDPASSVWMRRMAVARGFAGGMPCPELGADFFTRRLDPERETRRLIARLQAPDPPASRVTI
jgi:hypothetical protein